MPLAPHEEQDSVPVVVGDVPQVREVEVAVVPILPAIMSLVSSKPLFLVRRVADSKLYRMRRPYAITRETG
jgi:hypothetical protein